MAGHLAPAVGGDLAILGVQADDDVAGKGAAGVMQETGALHCGRAYDDVADAGVQVALDGVQVADAAAQLHRDLIEVVVQCIVLHHLQDGPDCAFILRLAGEGAVQVHQMQAARALL